MQGRRGLLHCEFQFCVCTGSSNFPQQRSGALGADRNILDRPEQLPVKGSEISQGIYAPTIRFHDGLFYMITTNVSYGGNFIVTAKDPAGPWSDPYYLGEDAPGIDPSLFFDDDGKCYYCGTQRTGRSPL